MTMYPSDFAYQAPTSLADVLSLLQQGQQMAPRSSCWRAARA